MKKEREAIYDRSQLLRMGNKIDAGKIFLPNGEKINGMAMQYTRDHGDVMNNYYINIAARAFTNIESKIVDIGETDENATL